MKKQSLILLFAISIVVSRAQDSSSDKQAVQMLKEFYTAYSTVKFVVKDSAKWNSLQKRYSTKKLSKEAKEWYNDGHDLYTNDWGIDIESLKNMTIIKDATKANSYIISYIVSTTDPSNNPIKKKVILHVTAQKDDGSCKIASVK